MVGQLFLLVLCAGIALVVAGALVKAAPGWRMAVAGVLHPPITRRYRRGDVVPVPAGFHGALEFSPPLCLACRACAYVCPTDAVGFADRQWGFQVTFSMERCIFCGRCQADCPTAAIRLGNSASLIGRVPGDLTVSGDVSFETCPDCGSKMLPAMPFLRQIYHGVPGPVRETFSRCPRCRLRLEALSFKDRLRQQLLNGTGEAASGDSPGGEDKEAG